MIKTEKYGEFNGDVLHFMDHHLIMMSFNQVLNDSCKVDGLHRKLVVSDHKIAEIGIRVGPAALTAIREEAANRLNGLITQINEIGVEDV